MQEDGAAATLSGFGASTATLVTQLRVRPGEEDRMADWQERLYTTLTKTPGLLELSVMPPKPPAQVDWVIVQRFADVASGRAWLGSPDRLRLFDELQPALVGQDDSHLIQDAAEVAPAETTTAIISMQVRPGQEEAFQQWQRRIAAAEADFPGFTGYKLEPPIPGVQDDWTTVLRFNSDEHLEAWLDSPQRQKLLDEAAAFNVNTHTRKVHTGFQWWFTPSGAAGAVPPPAWKQNMIVLLALYPTVFLFGYLVQTPLLVERGVPFWLALFIGNAVSTVLLGYLLVPQANRLFNWWLQPPPNAPDRIQWIGAAVIMALYALFLLVFSQIS